MKRVCKQCGKEFELSHSEIKFYKEKNLALPRRCKECRDANKQKKGGPANADRADTDSRPQSGRGQEQQSGKGYDKQSGKEYGVPSVRAQGLQSEKEQGAQFEKANNLKSEKVHEVQSKKKNEPQAGKVHSLQPDNKSSSPARKFGTIAIAAVLVVVFAVKALFGWTGPAEQADPAIQNQAEEIPALDRSAEGAEESLDGSAGITFRNQEMLEQHFQKHGIEMGFSTAEEYQAAAAAVVGNADSLHKLEAEDGDDVYYLESTNEFVIVSTDGYIRTYFNPKAGIDYYNKQ